MQQTSTVNLYGRRAIEHATKLAKPRQTGSQGEKETREHIISTLRSLGYKTREEPFTFQANAVSGWRAYLIGLMLLASLTAIAAWMQMPLACSIMGAGMLIYGIGAAAFNRNLLRQSLNGNTQQSSNIFATPPGLPCFGPRVLLCAHYDSKTQSVSLGSRMKLIASGIGILVMLSLLAIAQGFWSVFSPWVYTAGAAGIILIALRLCFLSATDRSSGAIDNAAGVGILLELAERFRLHEMPHGREVAFFFSSASEEGSIGAMYFLAEHTGALHERPHQVINVDLVGADSPLCIWGGGKSSAAVEETLIAAAAKSGLKLQKIPMMLGTVADHLPFSTANIPAVTLTSPFGTLGKVHTPADSTSLLSQKAVGEIVQLLENVGRNG